MDKKVHCGKGLNRCCGCCKLRVGFFVWAVLKELGVLYNIISIIIAGNSDTGYDSLYEPFDLTFE